MLPRPFITVYRGDVLYNTLLPSICQQLFQNFSQDFFSVKAVACNGVQRFIRTTPRPAFRASHQEEIALNEKQGVPISRCTGWRQQKWDGKRQHGCQRKKPIHAQALLTDFFLFFSSLLK